MLSAEPNTGLDLMTLRSCLEPKPRAVTRSTDCSTQAPLFSGFLYGFHLVSWNLPICSYMLSTFWTKFFNVFVIIIDNACLPVSTSGSFMWVILLIFSLDYGPIFLIFLVSDFLNVCQTLYLRTLEMEVNFASLQKETHLSFCRIVVWG